MHTGCRAHIPAWGTLKDGGGDCLSQFSDDGENTLGALLVVQAAAAFLPPFLTQMRWSDNNLHFWRHWYWQCNSERGYATRGNVLGYALTISGQFFTLSNFIREVFSSTTFPFVWSISHVNTKWYQSYLSRVGEMKDFGRGSVI